MTDAVTVLVVDDQDAICNLVRQILQCHGGYSVLTATSGEEALTVFNEHRNDIRCLITDCEMPGLSGSQLAERLIQLTPDITIIFMSGSKPGLPGYTFLRKPFTPTQVLECVRESIHAANQKPPQRAQQRPHATSNAHRSTAVASLNQHRHSERQRKAQY